MCCSLMQTPTLRGSARLCVWKLKALASLRHVITLNEGRWMIERLRGLLDKLMTGLGAHRNLACQPSVRVEGSRNVARLAGGGWSTDAVVVDIGGCVDDGSLALEADVADFGINSSGHSAAVTALGAADELVAVSSCEPTSVARLLSHLFTISSLAPAARLHVVINRVRAPIVRNQGAADELRRFVATHTRAHEVVLVREDRETVDAAAARGLTPYERPQSHVRPGSGTLSRGLQSPLVATA